MDIVREFMSALVDPSTYDPRGNTYMLFGLLWGIPVPLFGLLVEVRAGVPLAEPGWIALNLLLGLHPVFFAVVFAALGSVRRSKNDQVHELLEQVGADLRELEVAYEELSQLDKLKDEVLGNVSHELKTPLVTIRGYSEMMASGRLGEVTDRQGRALGVVQRSATRLQARIDDILACARNQADLDRLERTPVPLADLVEEMVLRHQHLFDDKELEFRVETPPGPVRVLGDRQRLSEILDNLIDNALKFTSEGHVALRFRRTEGGRLEGSVSDTGCGIRAEDQAHIFERFRQGDGSARREYGGTGLGLAIVRANLLAHGCDVHVESAPGQGSTFTFELPLAGEVEPSETTGGGS